MNHQYADAQRRGNPITLLVTETTGAMSPTLCAALREMGKGARAHDSTCNGTAATSPATFSTSYTHHLRSPTRHAIVAADAIAV